MEHVDYDHVSATMTLGDLRAVIDGLPDDMPVLVLAPDTPEDMSTSSILPAASAEVRRTITTDHRLALTVVGTFMTGRYRVLRRLVLELSGLPVGGGAVVTATIEDVQEAVAKLGYRGERSMSNGIETGVVTWTFRATEGVSLAAVEDAVRRVVSRRATPDWMMVSR